MDMRGSALISGICEMACREKLCRPAAEIQEKPYSDGSPWGGLRGYRIPEQRIRVPTEGDRIF